MRRHFVRYIRSSPPAANGRAGIVERELPLAPGELIVDAWPVGEEWIAELIVYSSNVPTNKVWEAEDE